MTIFLIGIDQATLPLTRKLIKEGNFPNLEKLLNEGATNQVIPSFPAWTPTNWATIATGAETGTHGVFSWQVKMPTGQMLNSFYSYVVNAETIWEAAEKAGLKSGMVHYPASMPSRVKNGYVVDGDASVAYGENRFEITPSKCYTNLDLPNAEQIKLSKAKEWKNFPKKYSSVLETKMRIIPKFKGIDIVWPLLILDSEGKGFDRVLICREKDVKKKIAEVSVGEWSDWIFESFVVEGKERFGNVRFKLIELSEDASRFRLYRSQIMPTDGFTYPDGLGKELIEKIGPYQEYTSEYTSLLGWTDHETCFEEAEYQVKWFAKAALYLAREKGISLFYSHWHFLDHINHHHLANIDPSWSKYDPEDANKHWEIMRKVYGIIDRYVGTFLENIKKEDYLILLSDHGIIPVTRQLWIEKFLSDKGFLIRKDESFPPSVRDERWEENIDWEKTKVYLKSGTTNDFSIYVNAEGEKKAQIQDDLIRQLRTWVDEEIGKTPIAIALKKKDAAIIGCWGENIGDVIYMTEPEYTIAHTIATRITPDQKSIMPQTGITNSSHGKQLLTYQSSVSSHLAMFVIKGPRIKKGYERPPDKLGYIRMIDIAPTICYILGIKPPAQSQGAVIYDIFKGHEMLKKLPTDLVKDRELDERVILQKGMHDYSVLEKTKKTKKHYLDTLRWMKYGTTRKD